LPADQWPNRIVHRKRARSATRHMRRCQLVPSLLRPDAIGLNDTAAAGLIPSEFGAWYAAYLIRHGAIGRYSC
jgi:hypothetical protein